MQAHCTDLFLYVARTFATSIIRAVVKNATPVNDAATHHAIENVAGRQVSVLRDDARDPEIIFIAVSAQLSPVRLVDARRQAAGAAS